MMHNRKTEIALRKNIQRIHHRDSFRFLLAVWPDTWWWFMRLQAHLGNLPALSEPESATDSTEMAALLRKVSEHGNTLGNGKLRAAVLQEIETTAQRLQSHRIYCSKMQTDSALPQEWDWLHLPFPVWAQGCTGQIQITVVSPEEPETAEHDGQESSVEIFVKHILMHED